MLCTRLSFPGLDALDQDPLRAGAALAPYFQLDAHESPQREVALEPWKARSVNDEGARQGAAIRERRATVDDERLAARLRYGTGQRPWALRVCAVNGSEADHVCREVQALARSCALPERANGHDSQRGR